MNDDRHWLNILSGALADGRPVSRTFGFERGRPIDRLYIDTFLAGQAAAVRGRVLEVGDDGYTRRYGGTAVERADVLHASGEGATNAIVSDLAAGAPEIASGTYDCIIFTQTLHVIHDIRAVLETLRRILKAGGTLLATMPGITPVSRYDMDRWGDHWRLTGCSARKLFEAVFIGDAVDVTGFGNPVAATAFLNGLAVEDMPGGSLDPIDPDYEVTVAVAVRKALLPAKPRSGAAARAVVLMYHRIAALETDPQLLAVRPDRFRNHLAGLRGVGTPVPLARVAEGLRGGELPERAIAVTFDDGYADNLETAKPLLEAAGIPATVFVTTGPLGSAGEYWWDELERLILLPERLPAALRMTVGGRPGSADLAGNAAPERSAGTREWSVADADTPTPRHALYRALHAALLALDDPDEVERVLLALARWAGCPLRGREGYRPLDGDGVRTLAAGGLVEVGAHTVSHPNLGRLSIARQRDEIRQSRGRLEAILGQPVRSFAYPFGNSGSFDAGTLALLHAEGFSNAVTTRSDPVRDGDHPLLIPRLCVRDWPAGELVSRIARWLG